MKVNVPAAAPTTPPDMGASMKDPLVSDLIVSDTEMLVAGSMVDVSINRRFVGRSGRGLEETIAP